MGPMILQVLQQNHGLFRLNPILRGRQTNQPWLFFFATQWPVMAVKYPPSHQPWKSFLKSTNLGVSKNRETPPKWMVKTMENPMKTLLKWMIWGENPLFGGWTNPFEKYATVKLGIMKTPSFGMKINKKYLSCHHLVISWVSPTLPAQPKDLAPVAPWRFLESGTVLPPIKVEQKRMAIISPPKDPGWIGSRTQMAGNLWLIS